MFYSATSEENVTFVYVEQVLPNPESLSIFEIITPKSMVRYFITSLLLSSLREEDFRMPCH